MVLTGRIGRYVPNEDHLVVILLKPDGQLLGRIYVQPPRRGTSYALATRAGVSLSPSRSGSSPYSVQYLSDGPLDTGQIYRVFGRVQFFNVFEEQGPVLHPFAFLSGVLIDRALRDTLS